MTSETGALPSDLSRMTPTLARGLAFVVRFLQWRRRWLIAFAVIAIGCGVLHVINANSRENRALQRVRELGGYTGGPTSFEMKFGSPGTSFPLRLLAHLPSKHVVTGLVVEGKPATDADIAEFVAVFPNLCEVDVSSTQITDDSLAEIAKLPGLARVVSRHVPVTDAAIAQLAAHSNLAIVELDGTQITDAGLADLAKLRRLWTLSVSGTQITDAGLSHLSGKSLNQLDVSNTRVTDAAVAAFQAANPTCRVIR